MNGNVMDNKVMYSKIMNNKIMNNKIMNHLNKDNKISFLMKKDQVAILIALLLFALLLTFGLISNTVFASSSVERSKLITCVKIEKGDTLWNIALEYKTNEYKNLRDYIDEIKRCNGIDTDMIHEGQYLIIPYFEK